MNAIVRFASVLMVPIGLALFYSSVHNSYQSWCALDPNSSSTLASWVSSGDSWGAISSAILSTVGALLGMIPQGLVLLTSSVLAIATIRLARRKVLAQQLYCIETLARVDVLCLDKTGTITSGHMEVEGVYVADDLGGAEPAEAGRACGGPRRRSHRFRGAAEARCTLWHRACHVGRCERDLHGGPGARSRPRQCTRGPARHRLLLRQEVERRAAHGRCVRLRFGRVRHGRLAVRTHAGRLRSF